MPGDWEKVPEPNGVLFGAQLGWSPEREAQRLDPACRTCGATIRDGSRLYCAGCTRTGFEKRLRVLRSRSPRPRDPKPSAEPAATPKITRKEAKALARTAEGRDFLRSQGFVTETVGPDRVVWDTSAKAGKPPAERD